MKSWIMVLKAADAAARWHVHQRRKGAAKEPYINHLLEVATLVAEATDGKDLDPLKSQAPSVGKVRCLTRRRASGSRAILAGMFKSTGETATPAPRT
jgi:hypothetical protein